MGPIGTSRVYASTVTTGHLVGGLLVEADLDLTDSFSRLGWVAHLVERIRPIVTAIDHQARHGALVPEVRVATRGMTTSDTKLPSRLRSRTASCSPLPILP
jgi:hypothetical protein